MIKIKEFEEQINLLNNENNETIENEKKKKLKKKYNFLNNRI